VDRILDRLWCGCLADGQQIAAGENPGQITYLLNISQYSYDAADVFAVHYPIQDEVFLPAATWENLTQLLANILAARYTVLVHCRLGKSRAPSLCAAYLMRCGYSPEKALHLVQSQRPVADPHSETWQSVLAWWATPPSIPVSRIIV